MLITKSDNFDRFRCIAGKCPDSCCAGGWQIIIDEDSLEIYDETKNIFNPITLSDYNGFQADQKAAMEAKAVENGLLTQAKAQAVTITSQVLTPLADQYGLLLSVE